MKLEKTKSYDTYMSNKKYRKKTKPKSGVLRRKRDNMRYSELENEIRKYMRGAYDEDDYST